MKVIVVAGEFPPAISGIGDYTALLVSKLAALGCQITVLTTRLARAEQQQGFNGATVRRVLSKWGVADAKCIIRAIDEYGPETILNIQYGGFLNRRRPMINCLPLLVRALRPQCTVVVTLHEFRSQRLRWRLSVLPMVYAAHGVICVESSDRDCVRRWIRFKQPNVVSIPIAPNVPPVPVADGERNLWRRRLGIAPETPVVAFFGGADRQKGFVELVRAINILRRRSVAVRLLAIGPYEPWNVRNGSYEREVRKLLQEGEKHGWALTVGKSSAETVSRCLHAADLAAFPYLRGARPNRGSLLAAIAHGLPVVTTDGVDTPAGFDRQFNVALVPPNNVERLADCLEQIITSPSQRDKMRRGSLEASKLFAWPAITEATALFYRSLTARNTQQSNKGKKHEH